MGTYNPNDQAHVVKGNELLRGFQTHEKDIARKVRRLPLSDKYQTAMSALVRRLGPEYDVKITSGGQNPGQGTGSSRHDVDHTGHADTADFVLLKNGKAVTPAQDRQAYTRLIEEAATVFPGIGHYSWGVHVGVGSPAFWGPDTTKSTADPAFAAAYARGRKRGRGKPYVKPTEQPRNRLENGGDQIINNEIVNADRTFGNDLLSQFKHNSKSSKSAEVKQSGYDFSAVFGEHVLDQHNETMQQLADAGKVEIPELDLGEDNG